MKQEKIFEDADKRYNLTLRFFSICNRMQSQGDRFYEKITFKQIFLLSCLQSFEEYQPTLQELSEVMGCSRQNTKVIAQKLQDGGYILITRDSQDKRKQRVGLTDKAFSVEKKYKTQDAQLMKMLFEGINEEGLKMMQEILEVMEGNLSRISVWCEN